MEYRVSGEKRILLFRLSAQKWITPSTCNMTHWEISSIRTFYSLIFGSEPTKHKIHLIKQSNIGNMDTGPTKATMAAQPTNSRPMLIYPLPTPHHMTSSCPSFSNTPHHDLPVLLPLLLINLRIPFFLHQLRVSTQILWKNQIPANGATRPAYPA